MEWEGNWYDTEDWPKNQHRYNGKELNSDFGLDWYAYGARWYDAGIGRFTGVDPISDRFPWVSTYNYAENEPVGSIDLWGLQKAGMQIGIDNARNYVKNNGTTQDLEGFDNAVKQNQARARATAAVMGSLIIPGPEDVVLAGFLATKAGQGLAKLGAKALDGILSWRKGKGKIPQGPGAKGSKPIDYSDAFDLEARAYELHRELSEIAQEMTTTAVTEAIDESGNIINIVSSSEKYLPGPIKRALKGNETEALLKIGKSDVPKGSTAHHAEQTGIQDALNRGLTPTRQGVSRLPCSDCKKVARKHDVIQE